MSLRRKIETHNYIDIMTGLLMLIFLFITTPQSAFPLIGLIGFHALIKKGADERQKVLYFKSYLFAFHFSLLVIVLAFYFFPNMLNATFVIALMLLLRGIIGIFLFRFE